MTDSSRTQGGLICLGVSFLGLLYLGMLLFGSVTLKIWALAIPVTLLVLFVLGLAFWVGWTIMTVQVEPEPDIDAPAPAEPTASSSESS